MNEYEKLRAENIRRNQEVLRQMGLMSPMIKQQPPPPSPPRATSSKRPTAALPRTINSIGPIVKQIASIVKPLILFQCKQCWRLLCDNRVALYRDDDDGDDDFLCFVSVCNVRIDSFLNISDIGCLFNDVDCECGANVGRFYVATTPQLDPLRFMFALSRSALYSYTIQNQNASANQSAIVSKTMEMIAQTRSSIVELMKLDDDLDMMSAANIFYADSKSYDSFSDDLQLGF